MSSVASQSMLFDLFAGLVEPLLVVNSAHEVVYRSQAFEALLGAPHTGTGQCCESIVSGLLVGADGACCWSGLDAYQSSAETGLWRLTRSDGSSFAVLCHMQSINVGTCRSLLALRFRIPPDDPPPVAQSFFRAMRQGVISLSAYAERASRYMHEQYGVTCSLWIEEDLNLLTSTLVHAHGLCQSEAETFVYPACAVVVQSQDVQVTVNGRPEVFHVIVMQHANLVCKLAIGGLVGSLNERIYDVAAASLCTASKSGLEAATDDSTALTREALVASLTPSQREIVTLIAHGLSNKEIAKRQGISQHTVKSHIRQILLRAGRRKRIELVNSSCGTPALLTPTEN